jgi:hypothetical protein
MYRWLASSENSSGHFGEVKGRRERAEAQCLGPIVAMLLLPNYRRPVVPVISSDHPLLKTPAPFLSPVSGCWVSSKT